MTVPEREWPPPTVRDDVAHPELALCLGGADCVWADVMALEKIYGREWDGIVIAANDIGSHWPRDFDHWVSLHPNKFPAWISLREQNRLNMNGIVTWGNKRRERNPISDYQLQPWPGGSSGMLAVQVAWAVGCTRAVLCGIPLTPTPHFAETQERFGKNWVAATGHWKAWHRCRDRLDGWVRSMSGRTRDLLGVPSAAWLHAGVAQRADR